MPCIGEERNAVAKPTGDRFADDERERQQHGIAQISTDAVMVMVAMAVIVRMFVIASHRNAGILVRMRPTVAWRGEDDGLFKNRRLRRAVTFAHFRQSCSGGN